MANTGRNFSFKLIVDEDLCARCWRCVAGTACRGNAFIQFERGDYPFIDMSRCWGCLTCTVTCPHDAILKVDYGQAAAVAP